MAIEVSEKIKNALEKNTTIKALATIDKNGIPYVVFKGSIHLLDNDKLEYYEILESSQTNANLVASIWFDKTASINLLTEEKESFQLKVKPIKCITAGRYFETAYNKVREGGKDIDLGSIWQFEVLEEKEETFAKRVKEDEEKYPILKHVDRLLKK